MMITQEGISIPDGKLAGEITKLVRDTESHFSFIIPAASTIGVRWLANIAATVRS
jgi:hypothetical protein